MNAGLVASELLHLSTFKLLCGEDFYKNIILGTTCLDLVDLVDQSTGSQREVRLKEKGGFWYALIQKGAERKRVPRNQVAMRDLLFGLVSRDSHFLKSKDDIKTNALNRVFAVAAETEEIKTLREQNERRAEEERQRPEKLQQEQEKRAQKEREQALFIQNEALSTKGRDVNKNWHHWALVTKSQSLCYRLF